MLAIEPLAAVERQEELRRVRVGPCRGHGEQPAVREAQAAVVLILEGLAVGGLAALAGARRVAGLRHEVLDDAVEDAAVVVALEAELHKVAAGERRLLGPELHVERTNAGVQYDLALGRRLVRVDGQRRHDFFWAM